jgi:hypothetical protein
MEKDRIVFVPLFVAVILMEYLLVMSVKLWNSQKRGLIFSVSL